MGQINSSGKKEEHLQDWQTFANQNSSQKTIKENYSQQQEARYLGGEGGLFGTPASDLKTENKKVAAVPVEFDIDPKTMRLEADAAVVNNFYLSFSFSTSVPIQMRVVSNAVVSINEEEKTINSLSAQKPEEDKTYDFEAGNLQHFPSHDFKISLQGVSLSDLTRATKTSIPLVIDIKRKDKEAGKIERMLYFFVISKEKLVHIVIGKYIQIGGTVTALEDVYGIAKSELAIGQVEKEDCICCMENKVNTVIKPCNHMIFCPACAEIIKNKSSECPVCKTKMTGFIVFSGN